MADGDEKPWAREVDELWARELTQEELTEAQERWPAESPAEQVKRMRLSLRAKIMHSYRDPNGGRSAFGGPQPNSGRKSSKRLGEFLLDKVEEELTQKKVWNALESGLDAKDDPALRVKTAVALVKAVQGEENISLRREEIQRELDKAPLDEVRRIFAENMARAIERGDIDQDTLALMFGIKRQQDAIEGTATDVAA